MIGAHDRIRLGPQAVIRPEEFGGLVYTYDSRRLLFLDPGLTAIVAAGGDRPVGDLTARLIGSGQLDQDGVERLLRVLAALVRTGVLEIDREPPASVSAGPRPEPEIRPGPRSGSGGARARVASNHRLRAGLSAPICLTWEITYACNLNCVHCLSGSGRRAPDELTTAEAKHLIDEWAAMRVFYINVGGGEPMVRPDFRELMEHALGAGIGVKFSTNGSLIDREAAAWIASTPYLDLQISLDGATAEVNDPIRGAGSFRLARRAMDLLAERGAGFKINHVVTRGSFDQLDQLYELAAGLGARLRVTRLRPSGRGVAVWPGLRLTQAQNRELHGWLLAHPDVLTGDSFFHLAALGGGLDGLGLCGAGRIVCCVDPRGDVYACPFTLAPEFHTGNVRQVPFSTLWREAPLFRRLRGWEPEGVCRSCGAFGVCGGGCLAVKHFTGTRLNEPDPECVHAPEVADPTVAPPVVVPRPVRFGRLIRLERRREEKPA